MPVSVRYSKYAQVTLDSLGNGTVTIDGPKPGQALQITQVSVFVRNTTRIPIFNYYRGLPNDFNFVSGSVTGHRDTDDTPNITLDPGEFLTGIWSGADAGSLAFMVVYGVLYYGI